MTETLKEVEVTPDMVNATVFDGGRISIGIEGTGFRIHLTATDASTPLMVAKMLLPAMAAWLPLQRNYLNQK